MAQDRPSHVGLYGGGPDREEADPQAAEVDFVWETHVPRHWKAVHDRATVLNR